MTVSGFGIKYSPPCLYIFYSDNADSTRRRKIPLRAITAAIKAKGDKVDIRELVSNLKAKYSRLIEEANLNVVRVLLERVLQYHHLSPLISTEVSVLLPGTANKENDLNYATNEELKIAKAEMEVDFKRNAIDQDAPNFQYDVRKDFGPPFQLNTETKPRSTKIISSAIKVPVTAEAKISSDKSIKPSLLGDLPSLSDQDKRGAPAPKDDDSSIIIEDIPSGHSGDDDGYEEDFD